MELSITRVVAAAAAVAKNVTNLLVCIVHGKSHGVCFFAYKHFFLTEGRMQCFIIEWEDLKKVFVADKGVFPFFLPVKKYHDPIPAVAKVGGGGHSVPLLLLALDCSKYSFPLLSIEGRKEKMGGRAFFEKPLF